MSQPLRGKVALVVGASSGIGKAAAAMLAREGALVTAAARRRERLETLQSELSAVGLDISISAADTSSLAAMEELSRRAGDVDILVYAAGTNTPDRAMNRLRPEIWRHLLSANLDGAYYITQALLPRMRERRSGHLIYVSSISAYGLGDVSGAAYQASKRGLLGLAHAIRTEEKQNGIRTCVISPGLVDTEILSLRPTPTPPETVAKALRAEDVAEAILWAAKLPPRASVPEMLLLPAEL
jgi:serine 3-dehydrogenase